MKFCNALSLTSGLTPVYVIDTADRDLNSTNSTDAKKWKVSVNGKASGFRFSITHSLPKVDSQKELPFPAFCDNANKSGEALIKINDAVKDMTRLISEISAAVEEQRSGISQINIAVSELDSMTQKNFGLVDKTSEASIRMLKMAEELLNVMKQFKILDIE